MDNRHPSHVTRISLELKKGTLVLCPVHMARKTGNGITEYYNGELFLGIVEDPGDNRFGVVVVNLGPLEKYGASKTELLPVVQTDGSPELLDAMEIIENHSKRMQKALGRVLTSLLENL